MCVCVCVCVCVRTCTRALIAAVAAALERYNVVCELIYLMRKKFNILQHIFYFLFVL